MTTATITIKKPLSVADFKAELYVGLIDSLDRLMLPLTRLEWGQRMAAIVVTEEGTFSRGGLYDRPNGGEILMPFTLNQTFRLAPGDMVVLTINWPHK